MNGSRRTRVANGSGTTVSDVNKLIKQFQEMQKMMKKMGVSMGGGRGKKGKKGKGGGRRAPAGLPAGFGGPGGPDLESLLGQLPAGMPGGFPQGPR
jgi:signal recognition particle subunit SRP54